ncbi:LysR family transcriptional regulator [Ramlibacter sp. USB13]|uniref:LysR family transcriptional regulator n=1 Tax=Ramlibacter cellulosilyticus TaxID=2764187 RepID=A0A923SDL1_9BURK|nr:LysR family transcriptional regulator [Ramlibacter cellulosilyticus]MBC5786130.1 LysR family transcriptional regulator [Ramlibacter cellulosilyticus]
MKHSLQQMAAFAETARHGSFAAAARELGSAPSTLAKAVARLEASLQVKLFHRTTRQVSLTPDGERLFGRCERLLAELEALQADASGARDEPTGLLRVDLPIVLGRECVLPLLARMAQRFPRLQLDVRLQDAYADLVKEGIDVAVRLGPLKDSSLVAQRIGSQSMVLVASRRYVEAKGTPRRLEDLSAHEALLFRMPTSGRDRPWRFRQGGKDVEMQPPTRMRVNDGEGLVAAVRLDLGLAQLPEYFVRRELASGEVVEVLKSLRPTPSPILAVYPGARLVPARVRAFLHELRSLEV